MRDIDQIVQLWRRTQQFGEPAVLATVVKTGGSSYRLPGARLLITKAGQRAGSISGGCLEDDLVKRAWWLTENGPVVRKYDTTPEGEIGSGFGLGCNGIIHVLLERLEPDQETILDFIEDVRSRREQAGIAHCIQPPDSAGQRLTWDQNRISSNNIRSREVRAWLEQEIQTAVAAEDSRTVQLDRTEAFLETVSPPIRLLVYGAGEDAVPVTALAKFLGWKVSVFDGRAHYAKREKFPTADEVVVRQAGDEAAGEVDPWTVAILMTHSYSQDLEVLRQLAAKPPRYLGILGPRKRSIQLLADAGIAPDELGPALHTPMGLDIGADGPEQVALAVVAEIQGALNGRKGGPLREREGSIHAPDQPAYASRSWVHSISCA
jgi:xanthine dehydrogenase accessory factor